MLRVAGTDVHFDLERLPHDQLFHLSYAENLLLEPAVLGGLREEACDKT